jgi:hypothetical protein
MQNVAWELGQLVTAKDLNTGVKEWNDALTNPPRFMAIDIPLASAKPNATTPMTFRTATQEGGWTSVKSGAYHLSFKVPETGHYAITYHMCFRKPGAQTYGILQARVRHSTATDGTGGTVIHESFHTSKRSGRQSNAGFVIAKLTAGRYISVETDTPGSSTVWDTGADGRTGEDAGFFSAVLLDRS